MKTVKIRITTKDSPDDIFACGDCFAEVDYKDNYCWSCGATLCDGESVDDFEDLKKFNEQEKEE